MVVKNLFTFPIGKIKFQKSYSIKRIKNFTFDMYVPRDL